MGYDTLIHPHLFMVLIGGKPEGRHTEQHDVFFGIAKTLRELVPHMQAFWPELKDRMHIDSWRTVTQVDQYQIRVVPKTDVTSSAHQLFFVNLGGYQPNDMEEYHYKQLVVASDLGEATRLAKAATFWKHHVSSHIDDKYQLDVDDSYEINELLHPVFTERYQIHVVAEPAGRPDPLEVGYLKISKLLKAEK